MKKQFKLWAKAQELMKLQGRTSTNSGTKELFRIIDMSIAQGKEDELMRLLEQDIKKITKKLVA